MPNRIVAQWLKDNAIAELKDLHSIRAEVPYGQERSRIDIFALDSNDRRVYIEIKNTTLRQDDQSDTALFPDAKTERGTKHLRELRAMAESGHRAVILFFIGRGDVRHFAPARHIDPNYANELDRAKAAGVEVLPMFVNLNAQSMPDGSWSLTYSR
jgi:sugar fermentation stimulation protein A